MKPVSALAVLILSAALAAAGGKPAPGDSSERPYGGILFEFRVIPQYESAPSVAERGEVVLLGPGYALSRAWTVALLFATGSRIVGSSATRPVNGDFGFGGARLEVTYRAGGEGPLRPYFSAGAGLYSIINAAEAGYNGNGFHIGSGVAWEPADFFRGKMGLEYEGMRFFNEIGRPEGAFEPFRMNSLGVSVSVSFVPGLAP